jgi:Lon-like protease
VCDGSQMSAELPNPAQPPSSSSQGQPAQVWSDAERDSRRQQLESQSSENAFDRIASDQRTWRKGRAKGTKIAPENAGPRGKKSQILKSVGLIGFLVAWVGFNFYRFDYVVILPGGTDIVNERITVKASSAGATSTGGSSIGGSSTGGSATVGGGAAAPKTYPADGKLLWATVGVKNDVRGLDLLMGWLRGDSDVFKRELLYGKANRKEAAQQSREEMDDAKSVATVLAARRLGIPTVEGGAEVLDREKGRPVEKLLANGDVIVAADGKSICLSGDLRELMLSKKRGESISLTVLSGVKVSESASASGTKSVPGDRPAEGSVETAKPGQRTVVVPLHQVKGIKRQLMGVILGPSKTRPCRLPFDVDVNTARIGGPSAGLAMTLALLDRLSPGELTGGGKVAATGTIEADGSVGEVGGVKQKTASVRASGAKLFIVPIAEVALAKPHAGKMQVIGVRNLDEALAALRKVGGDPLPSPSR